MTTQELEEFAEKNFPSSMQIKINPFKIFFNMLILFLKDSIPPNMNNLLYILFGLQNIEGKTIKELVNDTSFNGENLVDFIKYRDTFSMLLSEFTENGKIRADKLQSLALNELIKSEEQTLTDFIEKVTEDPDYYKFESNDIVAIPDGDNYKLYWYNGKTEEEKLVLSNYISMGVSNITVDMVTGLTDLLNNFVKLTGTEPGNPITGLLEINAPISLDVNNYSIINTRAGQIDDDGGAINLTHEQEVNLVAGYDSPNSTIFKHLPSGLSSSRDHSNNPAPLDFVQAKFVNDKLNNVVLKSGNSQADPITGTLHLDATQGIYSRWQSSDVTSQFNRYELGKYGLSQYKAPDKFTLLKAGDLMLSENATTQTDKVLFLNSVTGIRAGKVFEPLDNKYFVQSGWVQANYYNKTEVDDIISLIPTGNYIPVTGTDTTPLSGAIQFDNADNQIFSYNGDIENNAYTAIKYLLSGAIQLYDRRDDENKLTVGEGKIEAIVNDPYGNLASKASISKEAIDVSINTNYEGLPSKSRLKLSDPDNTFIYAEMGGPDMGFLNHGTYKFTSEFANFQWYTSNTEDIQSISFSRSGISGSNVFVVDQPTQFIQKQHLDDAIQRPLQSTSVQSEGSQGDSSVMGTISWETNGNYAFVKLDLQGTINGGDVVTFVIPDTFKNSRFIKKFMNNNFADAFELGVETNSVGIILSNFGGPQDITILEVLTLELGVGIIIP